MAKSKQQSAALSDNKENYLEIDVTSVQVQTEEVIPFTFSGGFSTFLQTINQYKSQVLRKAANLLLSREVVGADGINFLDFDSNDRTKVTFLDKDRYKKFKDQNIYSYKLRDAQVQFTKVNVKRGFIDEPLTVESIGETVVEAVTTLQATSDFYGNARTIDQPLEVELTSDYKKSIDFSKEFIPLDQVVLQDYPELFHNSSDNILMLNFQNGPSLLIGKNNDGFIYHMGSWNLVCQDIKVKLQSIPHSRLWDSKVRYSSTLPKLLKKLFPEDFNDKELEEISNEMKMIALVNAPGYSLEIVNGPSITKYYNEKHAFNSGSLGSSCMRYDKCKDMVDFYEKLPEVVSLAILRKESLGNKIVARCLLWNIDGETFSDRVYSSNNESDNIMKNFAKNYRSIYPSYENYIKKKVYVPKELMETRDLMPYVDSFYIYNPDEGFLVNDETYRSGNRSYWQFRSQHGSIQKVKKRVCAVCGVDDGGALIDAYTPSEYLPAHSGCAIHDDARRAYIMPDHAAFVNYANRFQPGYVRSSDVVTLCNGETAYSGMDSLYRLHDRQIFIKHSSLFEKFPHLKIGSQYYLFDDPYLDDKLDFIPSHLRHFRTRLTPQQVAEVQETIQEEIKKVKRKTKKLVEEQQAQQAITEVEEDSFDPTSWA